MYRFEGRPIPEFKIGDNVICIDTSGSPLTINGEYVITGFTPGGSDVLLDGVYQSWDKRRFVKGRKKGLAPGLTLLNLQGRKGLAPELKQ